MGVPRCLWWARPVSDAVVAVTTRCGGGVTPPASPQRRAIPRPGAMGGRGGREAAGTCLRPVWHSALTHNLAARPHTRKHNMDMRPRSTHITHAQQKFTRSTQTTRTRTRTSSSSSSSSSSYIQTHNNNKIQKHAKTQHNKQKHNTHISHTQRFHITLHTCVACCVYNGFTQHFTRVCVCVCCVCACVCARACFVACVCVVLCVRN